MYQFLRLAVFITLVFRNSAWSDDWPQWRGPMRDGVWHEKGILQSFPPDGLKVLWRAPVGLGLSSPIVTEGRVFVTDVDLTQRPTKERVLCFDVASGKTLWTYAYEANIPSGPDQFVQGPIPTPICHDGKVYTIGRTDCCA
jgi:outer membrane protein assembly factor BamB